MREERLLERIRSWDRNPNLRDREDPRKVVDSVLKHLQRILNTRQGSVRMAEDFGTPDFTDFLGAFPDALRDIERTIRGTILKYEPRLRAVRVKFIDREEDALFLRFQIIAELLTKNDKIPVLFESVVESDGKVKIKV